MRLASQVRPLAVVVVAAAYGVAAIALAVSETPLFGVPFSLTLLLAVPLAVGALTSLAAPAAHRLIVAVAPWLPVTIAGGTAIAMHAVPPGYFLIAGIPWLGVGAIGGLAASFIRDIHRREIVCGVLLLLPLGAWQVERRYAPAELPVTIADSMEIAASARDVWQQLLEMDRITVAERSPTVFSRWGFPVLESSTLDEPRQGALRRIAASGGVTVLARVREWDDDEHLALVAGPLDSASATATRAWRSGVTANLFRAVSGAYDLESVSDTVTRLRVQADFVVASHANDVLQWRVRGAAQAAQRELLAVIRLRAEASRRASIPALTVEMRFLRKRLIDDLLQRYGKSGEVTHADVLYIDGERRIVTVGSPAPITTAAGRAAAESAARESSVDQFRAAMRAEAAHARTSVIFSTNLGALADSGSTSGKDSLLVEFEDWQGRCVRETALIAHADNGRLAIGIPLRSGCAVSIMAERIRRGQLLATLPISAGDLNDSWSVALAARGTVRVFMDSVVVRADSVRLRAKPVDGKPQTVDSIGVGLSLGGGRSWSVVRRGSVVEILRSFTAEQEWSRTRVHFMVPADKTFPVERSWPTFEVFLSVPKTPDNTYGLAWTYAHAPEGFFKDVRRVLP